MTATLRLSGLVLPSLASINDGRGRELLSVQDQAAAGSNHGCNFRNVMADSGIELAQRPTLLVISTKSLHRLTTNIQEVTFAAVVG